MNNHNSSWHSESFFINDEKPDVHNVNSVSIDEVQELQ